MPRKTQILAKEIAACTLCAGRFSETATRHVPRPVIWFGAGARILIAGQAPGLRVHDSGRPFTDPSGDRLRDWLGMSAEEFYDKDRVAIVPMALCFPGYDTKGADLPPPAICAQTWRNKIMEIAGPFQLTILVGAYAQAWHLGRKVPLTKTVYDWRNHAPRIYPLPHPSWRNNAWLKKNPWFEAELLPDLRGTVRKCLDD